MKSTILTAIMIAAGSLLCKAQDVQNQTEALAIIKQGNYTAYNANMDGDKYTGGIIDLTFRLEEVNEYRLNPGEHKEVTFINGGSKERPDEIIPAVLMPDNEAFPITYVSSSYEGNKKLQEEIGLVRSDPTKYNPDRFVFLDGNIYILEDYKDKDNYKLKAYLEYEEVGLTGLKLMKAVMKSPKKMAALQPKAKLQEYLDAAAIKQKAVHAEWIKKPASQAFVQNQKDMATLMKMTIRKMSEDWRNSDEYRRIQENNRRADAYQNANRMTVQNKTGQDIYVFESGSRNGTPVRSNGSGTFDCNKTLYYSFSGKSELNGNGSRFYSAGQSCGGSVVVQ